MQFQIRHEWTVTARLVLLRLCFRESSDPLFDSNQAQAWIVFSRDKLQFKQAFPELKVITLRPIMPFSYLLSGGHSVDFGLSAKGIKLCRALERRSTLDRRIGMFALIVVEKIS